MADLFENRKKIMVDYLVQSGFLKTKNIIDAFTDVPRHLFVLPGSSEMAYEDLALPLMAMSTISQPSTVACMLELLQPKSGEKILEVGTGSGWQACMLSACVGPSGKVVTMEIDQEVAELAKLNIVKYERFKKQKIKNVEALVGDGSVGHPEEAPYDKIIFTAASPEVSRQIIVQLRVGGRAVIPVGNELMQVMKIVDKVSESKITERDNGSFQFVPLRGQLGF